MISLFRRKKKQEEMEAYNYTLLSLALHRKQITKKLFTKPVIIIRDQYGSIILCNRITKVFLLKPVLDTTFTKLLIIALTNLNQFNALITFETKINQKSIKAGKKLLKTKERSILEFLAEQCGENLTCVRTENELSTNFEYSRFIKQIKTDDGIKEVFQSVFFMYSNTLPAYNINYTLVFSTKRFLESRLERNILPIHISLS